MQMTKASRRRTALTLTLSQREGGPIFLCSKYHDSQIGGGYRMEVIVQESYQEMSRSRPPGTVTRTLQQQA